MEFGYFQGILFVCLYFMDSASMNILVPRMCLVFRGEIAGL